MMSTLHHLFWVACGGALGAVLRALTGLGLARWLPKHLWVGTLVANLVGCAAFALLKIWLDRHQIGGESLRLFVFTGLLGAYTTFSTFESDAVGLWNLDQRGLALLYMAVSVVGGFGVFYALTATARTPA